MEPTHEGLVLRAFNSSKSACATMAFYDSFFTEFDTSNIDPEQYNLCRISMKSALSIFKVPLVLLTVGTPKPLFR